MTADPRWRRKSFSPPSWICCCPFLFVVLEIVPWDNVVEWWMESSEVIKEKDETTSKKTDLYAVSLKMCKRINIENIVILTDNSILTIGS